MEARADGVYLMTFGRPFRLLRVEDGKVVDAPPGMRWLVGWTLAKAEAWIQLHGGRLEREGEPPG